MQLEHLKSQFLTMNTSFIKCLFQASLLCFIALSFNGCGQCKMPYKFTVPPNLADGIAVSADAPSILDTALFAQGIKQIKCGKFKEVHSILIYKNDNLIVEEYFPGHRYKWNGPGYHGELVEWNAALLHHNMSVTKSFTSACVGLAIKNGFIRDRHQSIFDYLPDHQKFRNGGKENITIEHLLTMSSGLEWNEWGAPHGTPANDIDRIYFECQVDPVACVLERELIHDPGSHFTYNGGGIIILSEILENATGMAADSFMDQYLFKVIGIDSFSTYHFENGLTAMDGSLYITPRDMLKFGMLYLQDGKWDGESLFPDDWIERSRQVYRNNDDINLPIQDSGRNGYSYTWWLNTLDHNGEEIELYRAGGWGGQSIMIFPEMDMIIVFTGGNYAVRSKLFKFLRKYVLGAMV